MASRPPIGAGGDAPRLEIPVVADLAPFERVIQQDLPRRARDAGKRAAHALAEGISDRTGMQDRMKRIASQSVDDFVDSALAWLKRRQAEIQEEVARGFIDEKKADEMGRRAERAFNDRILRELDRRAASGRLSNQDYLGLAGALKRTAERGVENMKTPFERFQRWMRAGFAAGLIGAAAYTFSRVVSMARSARFPRFSSAASLKPSEGHDRPGQVGPGFPRLSSAASLKPAVARAGRPADAGDFRASLARPH